MKLRAVVTIFTLLAVLTACGGTASSGEPAAFNSSASSAAVGVVVVTKPAGDGGSGGSDFCAKLQAAEAQLDDINKAASGGDLNTIKSEIDAQIGTFRQLEKGAPEQVQPAIEDIVEVLQDGQKALADPAHADPSAMQELGVKLPSDMNALGNYVSDHCYGG